MVKQKLDKLKIAESKKNIHVFSRYTHIHVYTIVNAYAVESQLATNSGGQRLLLPALHAGSVWPKCETCPGFAPCIKHFAMHVTGHENGHLSPSPH